MATSCSSSEVRDCCLTSPSSSVRRARSAGRARSRSRAERAERVVALGPGPLPVVALLVPRGDVVGDGVAEQRCPAPAPAAPRGRRARRSTTASSPSKWTSSESTGSRIASRGTDHRGRRLEEDQRGGRGLATHLGDVGGVVLADSDDLAGQQRGEQPHVRQRPPLAGQLDRAERVLGDAATVSASSGRARLPLDLPEVDLAGGGREAGDTHGRAGYPPGAVRSEGGILLW